MSKGKYIVIEGHDGTGKSTQVKMMRERLMAEYNIDSIEFHEPAGGPIADAIRDVIKNGELERDGITNILLFSAARHELWTKQALPALKLGKWVVTARSYLSTIAYQGYGEGSDIDQINLITKLSTDEHYMKPDYEFILNVSEKERVKRISKRGVLEIKDTFESKEQEFQDKVRAGYLQISKDKNIPIISADPSKTIIANELWKYIKL